MACSSCSSSPFRDLTRAMAKAASARLRGVGALKVADNWTTRAAICENCPLMVVRGNTSYCGTPFLQKIDRDPGIDGCGCPTRDKARSPAEHCPLDARHRPATQESNICNCKWCRSASN